MLCDAVASDEPSVARAHDVGIWHLGAGLVSAREGLRWRVGRSRGLSAFGRHAIAERVRCVARRLSGEAALDLARVRMECSAPLSALRYSTGAARVARAKRTEHR
jgi:hypothetical protein